MADDTTVTNEVKADAAAVDEQNTTEPATRHDVAEGAGLGVVGGAVIGALAGGPAGAAIGVGAAILGGAVGGVASGAAVDAVDKHDHDYVETVTKHDTTTLGTGTDADSAYRSHYDANYAATGASYDEYDPAYRHGDTLANDPQYQNSDWNSVESGARGAWETRQPGTWDRFKGSVRHGWDRAKSKV